MGETIVVAMGPDGDKMYPHPYPCRISDNSRVIHCSSCEAVPGYLKKIELLEKELEELKNPTITEEMCGAKRAAGWGALATCSFPKHGKERPHSWVADV